MGNQLRILPPDLGKLTKLRVLAADSNQLTILPGGCPCLRALGIMLVEGRSSYLVRRSLCTWSPLHCLYGIPCRKHRVFGNDPGGLLCRSAGELRQCALLEELTLQHNRLTSVLLSFASLRCLK